MNRHDRVATLGLTFRCRLATRSRMFSSCPSHPATATDAYTLAYPGTLPTPNRRAIDLAIRLALALGAEIAPLSRWVRKHLDDPGLAKGYQISQHTAPLARGGRLVVDGDSLELTQLRLAEDLGIVQPDAPTVHGRPALAHAGASLVEVVAAPVSLRAGPEQASRWLGAMQAVVLASAVAAADTGALRCDATISLGPPGQPGTACTLPELTTGHALARAIAAELERQATLLDRGDIVTTPTPPPCYLPEPDLPPLRIDPAWIERVRAESPLLRITS